MEIELIRYFVKVVQNGSFSKAAALMKIPKSTVSKAISRLEKETGTKLLLRTTRSLTLTATGRAFYDSSLGPIQTLEDAQKSLYGKDSMLSGLVKITAPEDLGSFTIAPIVAELSRKHPELQFELVYTDTVVDLIKDGFDLAFRIGKLNESSFKAKKLGEVYLVLVASPGYLKTKDNIKDPRDLINHDCLSYHVQQLNSRWNLKSKKESLQIPIKARISSNQMTSIMNIAIAGGGIAFVPHYLCKSHIDSGRLVEVLPEWRSPGFPVSMVTPLSVASSARLKITSDRLSAAIQKALAF